MTAAAAGDDDGRVSAPRQPKEVEMRSMCGAVGLSSDSVAATVASRRRRRRRRRVRDWSQSTVDAAGNKSDARTHARPGWEGDAARGGGAASHQTPDRRTDGQTRLAAVTQHRCYSPPTR